MVMPSAPLEEFPEASIDPNQQYNMKKVFTALTNKSGLMGTLATVENYEISSYFDTGAELLIMSYQTVLYP